MSNPDRGEFNSVYAGLVGGLFIAMAVGLLFKFNPSNLTYILWIGVPVTFYLVCITINFITQNIICHKIDAEKALLGGLPAVVASLIGLGLSWISYCRIPVASVFAPLFVGGASDDASDDANTDAPPTAMNSVNSAPNPMKAAKNAANIVTRTMGGAESDKKCCEPKFILEKLEQDSPGLKGLSYAFYLFFSMIFGTVIGNSIATVC